VINLRKKVKEVTSRKSIDGYKNLTGALKMFKRVHVDTSFVLLFYEKNSIIYFVDYLHHDVAYSDDKKLLKRYAALFLPKTPE
jgi:mRNA-degrading endonuclease RelE of RelBE toxin-antitoxin system